MQDQNQETGNTEGVEGVEGTENVENVATENIKNHADNSPRKQPAFRIGAFVFGILIMASMLMLIISAFIQSGRFGELRLYFADYGYNKLVPVIRRVESADTRSEALEKLLQQLIYGPMTNKTMPSLPSGLKLITSWISGDTAFLNFDRKLMHGIAENADAERIAVYSIVNTVVDNIEGVSRVQILIEGVPMKTLRGLTRIKTPLEPRDDLVSDKEFAEELE